MEHLVAGRITEEHYKKIKLDVRDKKILHLLSLDARSPISKIARHVRLSRDTVNYRLQRLQKNGIILGFIPRINLSYFGFQTFHVFMVINSQFEQKKKRLIHRLHEHAHTVRVMEYHATWDLEWVLISRNLQEFDETVNEITHEFSDIIVRRNELTTIKDYKSVHLPGTIYHDTSIKPRSKKLYHEHRQLDALDIMLLKQLAENARMTTYELSRACKTSPDTISYRLKGLLACEVIKGFTTLINLSALNQHWYTFCINVRTFTKASDSKFKEFIFRNPHVLRAVKVLGDWDLLLYSVVDTPAAFHSTFKTIHDNFIELIANYETWNAYKEHAFNAIPPILFEKN